MLPHLIFNGTLSHLCGAGGGKKIEWAGFEHPVFNYKPQTSGSFSREKNSKAKGFNYARVDSKGQMQNSDWAMADG